MSAGALLPLSGKWLRFLIAGVLIAAPFTRVTMSLMEAATYWLACGLAMGVWFAVTRGRPVDKARGVPVGLRRAGGAIALSLGLGAFAFWIFPTPWHEWQEGSETYRRHRITGSTQAMMECGCDWSPVD